MLANKENNKTFRKVLHKNNQRRINIKDSIEAFNKISSKRKQRITKILTIPNNLLSVLKLTI